MEVFNRDDGFLEGLLRGYRSTFLTDGAYANLKEGGQRGGSEKSREDFEDLRLALQESDYGNFLAAESALDPKIIATRATAKWVKEFKYFRATATGALARFLDFVTYEYMIDNILDLVKAATSTATVDMAAVVENCHPLGMLEPSVMKSILAFEDLAEDFPALYRAILVDTPVGHYFTQFMQDVMDEKAATDPDSVRSTFSDIPMTIIENSIKKLYLEDFNHYCRNILGGDTGDIMGELLDTRADMLTINITYNSLSTDFSRMGGSGTRTSRASLFPSFGKLYPAGSDMLASAEDEEGIRRALVRANPEYAKLWDSAPTDSRGFKDVNDTFFQHMVRAYELAFEGQFHYACFYSYVKLKEQEVKNIAWLATCMEHGVYSEMDRIFPIFSKLAPTKH